MIQLDLVERSVFVVDRYTLHRVQRRIGAVDDLAEDGVFAIQMSLLGICHEELSAQDSVLDDVCSGMKNARFVRVWARIGHCNYTAGVELSQNSSDG